MKKQLKSISMLAVTGLVVATVVSCQDPDYPAAQPSTAPSTVLARFAFVNASPDAPAVNFYIENNQVSQGKAISTTPQSVSYATGQAGGGGIQLRAKAASGNIGGVIGSSDVLYRAGTANQTNFIAVANTSYTFFLTDTLNRPKPTVTNGTNLGGPQFLVVTDTLTAPAAGTAKVRFFNLAPDVSATSARLINAAGTSAATLGNRPYRTVAGTTLRYTAVPAGAYVTQVYSATAAPSSLTATPATSTTLTLADGKIYTIYSQGLNRAKTLSVGTVQHN